ncbi:MAG: sigma-E factor negative regulatory protein [Gammaproteobacteria bacterium]|nr:sigma-E factor negative regulatory protein [Gammaproteobacteria bacterium]
MTERIKEQLSSFLDGELPEPESALLLKRLERDDDLRGALSRYSLIGAVLRSDGDAPAARQVAARVSAAIAREPSGRMAVVSSRSAALLRPLAGLAVAAGVAALALLLMPGFDTKDNAQPEPVRAQVADTPVEPVTVSEDETDAPSRSYTTPAAADGPGGLPAAQFANYLVAHSSYASPLVRRSVVTGLIAAPQEAGGGNATAPESPQGNP